VEKTAKYRYDVVEVGDWYAEVVDDPADGGHAWFDLELGIVVNQASARAAAAGAGAADPQRAARFQSESLAAHGEEDQMLATLPDGSRVALPWGRVRPILTTLGELYFSDKIKTSLRMATLDAARLDELARNVELHWTGGEALREMGAQAEPVRRREKRVADAGRPAGHAARLPADGLSWMQFLREYGLAGILADDMGLGKTVQTWPTSWWKKKPAA
jgi:hypothetical protein